MKNNYSQKPTPFVGKKSANNFVAPKTSRISAYHFNIVNDLIGEHWILSKSISGFDIIEKSLYAYPVWEDKISVILSPFHTITFPSKIEDNKKYDCFIWLESVPRLRFSITDKTRVTTIGIHSNSYRPQQIHIRESNWESYVQNDSIILKMRDKIRWLISNNK